jgi:hypothetical protein
VLPASLFKSIHSHSHHTSVANSTAAAAAAAAGVASGLRKPLRKLSLPIPPSSSSSSSSAVSHGPLLPRSASSITSAAAAAANAQNILHGTSSASRYSLQAEDILTAKQNLKQSLTSTSAKWMKEKPVGNSMQDVLERQFGNMRSVRYTTHFIFSLYSFLTFISGNS